MLKPLIEEMPWGVVPFFFDIEGVQKAFGRHFGGGQGRVVHLLDFEDESQTPKITLPCHRGSPINVVS